MKHLKKFLALALVCVMALTVLTGCGKSAKDYQGELTGKLKGANIGVTVDAQMNKNAETVAKGVSDGVWAYITGNGNYDYEKLINDVIKKAHLTDNTQWCVGITYKGTNANVGFDGSEDDFLAPSDFFVKELKNYNASHSTKLTKVGVGLYEIPFTGVDVVILLAE